MADKKDIQISKEDVTQALNEWTGDLLKQGFSLQNIEYNIQNYTKEVRDELIKKARAIALDKQFKKVIDDFGNELTKSTKEIKKPSFWQRIGFKEDPTRDDMAAQYRARQVAGGIESLLEGRLLSSLQQFGSAIPKVAHFMSTGLYASIVAFAQATIKAIDGLSRLEVTAKRLSGGTENNDKYSRSFNIYAFSSMYNQKSEDFDRFLGKELGWGMKQKFWKDPTSSLAHTWASSRASFEQVGASPDKANSIIAQQLSIGRSAEDIRKFNYNLVEATKSLDTLSSDKFLNAYEELNRTFIANNINGMANAQTLAKFQVQLERGTLSVSDFTRGLTSRKQSSTGNLASIGAMLAERGLGGKELLDAYAKGDMIAVAGAVRRGGVSMQRDIEKIAPELAKSMGTSDIREALALQSDTTWGQLTGDLKKVEVQNILSRGGSLSIGTQATAPEVSQSKLNEYESELIKESTKLKSSFQAVGESAKLATIYLGKLAEQKDIDISLKTLSRPVETVVKIANPNH